MCLIAHTLVILEIGWRLLLRVEWTRSYDMIYTKVYPLINDGFLRWFGLHWSIPHYLVMNFLDDGLHRGIPLLTVMDLWDSLQWGTIISFILMEHDRSGIIDIDFILWYIHWHVPLISDGLQFILEHSHFRRFTLRHSHFTHSHIA